MLYPGNPELSAEAQERVTTAFRQAVAKLQEGRREEATIGLEFVLRLDPSFAPASNLRDQLASGAQEIDLSDIIAQMQAPTTDAIDAMLVEAVESYNRRDFVAASQKVEQVLLELPGHQEARQLQRQIQDALKVETQVGQFLTQAREALHRGDPQEAANFVMMAQALDPHHSGIAPTLQEIYASGAVPPQPTEAIAAASPQAAIELGPDDGFEVQFDELDEEAAIADEPEVAAPQAEFIPDAGDAAPLWETMSVKEVSAPPVAPREQAPAAAPTPAADDLSDLFEAEPAVAGAPEEQEGGGARLDQDKLGELLERGERLFATGDFKGAIDAWSRVYLLETEGRVVTDRIAEATGRLEEAERRVEHLVFEAQEAAVAGEAAKALELINEVLAIDPDNVRARELSERLSPATAAPPAAAPEPSAQDMPELDEELFDEAQEPPPHPPEPRPPLLDIELPEKRRVLGLPLRTAVVMGAGGVLLAVAIGLAVALLGGSDDSSPGDVYALQDQTEQLFKEGKAREALTLVEAFQTTDPTDKQVLERLAKRYQKALATPTATPIPAALTAAQGLLARGLVFHAYGEVTDGLKRHPDDGVLGDLKRSIEALVPRVAALQTALTTGNYQTAASIADDLTHAYPDRPDLEEILERSLYNAALAEMRAYNLAGAEGYLRQYEELHPGDETVARIMEFIDKYKARPVDMTLQVFIGSLQTRARQPVAQQTSPLSTPTPAAAVVVASPAAGAG